MTDNDMRSSIYDHDIVNNSGYIVRDALEVDWSKGKSWSEHMKEQSKIVTSPKAHIKYAHND